MIAAFLFASALLTANQSCPWLDTATAAGVLGGQVASKVSPTSCEFTRARSKLRIEVHRSSEAQQRFVKDRAHCGAAIPLKAIGNQAFLCPKNHEATGRVRNAVFTVRVNAPEHSDEKAKQVAEEVAGALF